MRKTKIETIDSDLQRARYKLGKCADGLVLRLTREEAQAYLTVLYDLKARVMLHRQAFTKQLESIGTTVEVGWGTNPNAELIGRTVDILVALESGSGTELYTPDGVRAVLDYERELDEHIGFLASLQ